MKRKGIILAGGYGTRLYPVTQVVSKQLLPVFNKPMIYYPLSILMLTGIREILVISTPQDSQSFERLLGDGSQWGLSIEHLTQNSPEGLAHAFIIGESFIGESPTALILGDNIFYSHSINKLLDSANTRQEGATIFGYHVRDPERYGIVEFNKEGRVLEIEEKPKQPRSNYAITGLYFYDPKVVEYAKKLKPSKRGEYEITDLNKYYLKENKLFLEVMGRGYTWLDTGTHESLLEANQFVQAIEHRQGLKIACLEEIALKKDWINANEVKKYSHSKKSKPLWTIFNETGEIDYIEFCSNFYGVSLRNLSYDFQITLNLRYYYV